MALHEIADAGERTAEASREGPLVGEVEDEPWLPEDEARAAEKVQRIVSALAGGAIEATADLTALLAASDPGVAAGRGPTATGPFGDGALVAPVLGRRTGRRRGVRRGAGRGQPGPWAVA